MSVLELRSVRKRFRSGHEWIDVLQGVDFAIGQGEAVSIQGQSGSGKTTLLNIMAAIEMADQGELFWDGDKVGDLTEKERLVWRGRRMGFVFQAFHLVPELSVLENVLLPARVVGVYGASHISRAKELLERLNLGNRQKSSIRELSGGEKQRVAIARALINQPHLILADEPTGNLDEHSSESVMQELLKLVRQEGAALVLVTHSQRFALELERRYRLTDGILTGL